MIKLFVTDLDGTLLNEAKQVEERDKLALAELVQNGVSVCFASGRMDGELVSVMEEVEGTFHRISHNGAYIYTDQGDPIRIGSPYFQRDIAGKIFQAALDQGLLGFVSTSQEKLIPEYNDLLKDYENRLKLDFTEQPALFEKLDTELLPSKICIFGEPDKLRAFQQQMREELSEKTHDSFISGPECLDFMPKNISKGRAIQRLLEHLEIRVEEMACVGDSYNDLSMLDLTPYSFAMSDAEDTVKAHANSGVVQSVAEAAEFVLQYNNQKQLSMSKE